MERLFQLCTLALLLVLFNGVKAVRITSLIVPSTIPEGQSEVSLICDYDLQGDELYSVKWYKDANEFYRYIPGETPAKRHFALPNVQIDVDKSKDGTVYLQNVVVGSSGVYRCEVSGDAPLFRTTEEESEMRVYEEATTSSLND